MHFDLNTTWFILIGLMLIGYIVLDGFDLGVGALHLFTKTDEERRLMINSIGPVWDGNEVWLVVGGGALFAAFPDVYATVFSGFYLAFILLLFCFIFRAVAIEFRSKQPMKWWRNFWDVSFSVASILASILVGVALGNIVWGIPLDGHQNFYGSLLDLIHPYSVLLGVTSLALFMMHGAIYLVVKTEGELNRRVRRWINNSIIFFIICYAVITMATLLYVPRMTEVFKGHPALFTIPILNMLAIANIPRAIYRGRDFEAFISSAGAMFFLMILFGIGMYPNLVISNPNPEFNLTIYNAASSHKTLKIMLIFAAIGAPLVLSYTACIYWIFRGKVKLSEHSY